MPAMSLTPTKVQAETSRRVRSHALRTGETIRRIRTDAGLTRAAVGRMSDVDPSYLRRIEAGSVIASIPTLTAIGVALGCDTSLRFFEGSGPRLHDRFQAPMVESFLAIPHPARWQASLEVPVTAPRRGVVDVVLDERSSHGLRIATEMHSVIHRIEQQLRWMHEKADGLATHHAGAGQERRTSSLLVLRSTRDNRELVGTFLSTFRSAFPARPADILDALTTIDGAWPGAGVLWMQVERGVATVLDGPPRGVALGR